MFKAFIKLSSEEPESRVVNELKQHEVRSNNLGDGVTDEDDTQSVGEIRDVNAPLTEDGF